MSKAKTIMLVKNRALGDSIMGLSAVSYLKLLYPKSNIIYAVPQWIAPLYTQTQSDADLIYPLKLLGLSDFFKLLNDIRKLKIDHIHEMHQSGRGAKFFKVISLILGIRYTAHNHHLKTDTGIVDQGKILPLIQRDLDGIYSSLGRFINDERPNYLNFQPKLVLENEKIDNQMIIFGVVATRETKKWPLENFVKLANLIQEKYPNKKIAIPLSKGAEDQKIKGYLLSLQLPENISIHEWELKDLPSAFLNSSFYIGNDTGLKHLAVAVGIKTYTFFGPEPANEWHPYSVEKHPYFYLENLECRTRNAHYCALNSCDLSENNMECLKHFSPEMVFKKIAEDLK